VLGFLFMTHRSFVGTFLLGVFLLGTFFLGSGTIFAATNISPVSAYSQFLDFDLNTDTVKDRINWRPSSFENVEIQEGQIPGMIWGETVGWINLNPDTSVMNPADLGTVGEEAIGLQLTCSGDTGTFSGHAWGENTGWINFAPSTAGVTLENDGSFSGYAWAENYGWIDFTCPGANTCVKTDFICGNKENQGDNGGSNFSSFVQFVSTQYSVNEGFGAVIISLQRLGNFSGPARVLVSTLNISALASLDYTPAINTLVTWADGEGGIKTITIPIIEDGDIEINERFKIFLSAPVNTIIGTQSQGEVTIIDNDIDPLDPGQIRFVKDSYNVTEGGSLLVEVTRVGGSLGSATAEIRSSDGSATLDDYTEVIASVSWGDGELGVKTISVATLDDILEELDESFVLTITNTTGALLTSPDTASVLIKDNDAPVIASGCLDPHAQNYNPHAEQHDESACTFVPGVTFGCLDPNAQNYNLLVDEDNGSCEYGEVLPETTAPSTTQSANTSLMKVFQAIALLGLISGLPGIISRISNVVFSFIAIWKKNRPWGTVYDAKTKQPLDPAYVTLHNEQGEEIASAITDADGRYSFVVERGRYYLKAQKTHYAFPSQIMVNQSKDELYNDIYHGELFEITDKEHDLIIRNIPMDPVEEDWNEKEKSSMGKSIFSFFSKYDRLFARFVNFFFVTGFAFSIYAIIASPLIWNYVVFALYILMIVLYLVGFAPTSSGKIMLKDGAPLAFTIVRVFNAHLNKEVGHKVTDEYGNYFILVKRGSYYVTLEKKEADGTYTHIYTSEVFKARRGVVNRVFKI
jgi:hypothetical protein